MTSSEYPSGPQPVTLLDRFDKLKLEGWLPSQAVEILSLLHLCGHFHTPFAPVGPSAVGFWLGPNSNLVVRSDAGELDPSKIPTRDPGFYDPKPTPFTMPAFNPGLLEQEHDKLLQATLMSKSRTVEQYLVENPGALKNVKELDAAKWLAPKLTPDDEVTRETYRDECMNKFGLSEVGYEERVWYAARFLAGLPRKRKSGAPKGRRKASISRKPRKVTKK